MPSPWSRMAWMPVQGSGWGLFWGVLRGVTDVVRGVKYKL